MLILFYTEVAVTCRLPLKCGSENCGKEGTNRLKPGNDILTIITKDGKIKANCFYLNF